MKIRRIAQSTLLFHRIVWKVPSQCLLIIVVGGGGGEVLLDLSQINTPKN